MIFLRSLLFTILAFFWTYFMCLALLWTLLFPRRVMYWGLLTWERSVAWIERNIMGIRYQIIGLEHVPQGACIIAAKHQSAWETLKLHLLFNNPAIVLKQELLKVPVWGWYAKRSGMIPIDRAKGSVALVQMKKAANAASAEGRKIVIFPQGTRLAPHVKRPYKVGVAVLYDELKLPVIPMALNSGLFWPKNSLVKKPGLITIEFLPPIPPGLPRTEMMRELETRLEEASDRLANVKN